MQVRYFVHHQNRNLGPWSFEEIEKRFQKNELFPTDYVFLSESGDWQPILEFIMVHSPKERVVQPTLKTKGAATASDSQPDWNRFASGLPKQIKPTEFRSADPLTSPAYPLPPPELMPTVNAAPDFPPPPRPPRAVVEKRVLERTARKPSRPPLSAQKLRPVDTSATTVIEVLPAKMTYLKISIHGEARVDEYIQVQIEAVNESGQRVSDFQQTVYLGCDQRIDGNAPLNFKDGVATVQLKCLVPGAHRFFISTNPLIQPNMSSDSLELAH